MVEGGRWVVRGGSCEVGRCGEEHKITLYSRDKFLLGSEGSDTQLLEILISESQKRVEINFLSLQHRQVL